MWSEKEMAEKMNKIHCIDCLEFMRNVPDKYFDLVLTDPPYGIKYQSKSRKHKHRNIINDNNLEWLPEFAKEIDRITKKDAHMYIFCSWHFVDVFKQEISKYRKVKNILIWEKNNIGMGDLFGDYAPQHEMILFCSNGNKKLNGGRSSNIIKSAKTQNELHPTQKPIELIRFLIDKSAVLGDKVFDPFMGSGTTAVVCESLGLDWCGCELEPDYIEIANKRLKKVQTSIFRYM